MNNNPQIIVVMGVSGSGKSTFATELATRLKAKLIDGDDLHPRVNINKMANGIALDDTDRAQWLIRINDAIYSLQHKHESAVIVCSALKQAYRQAIRQNNQSITVIYLAAEQALIEQRLLQRQGHFMKSSMIDSQFAALEPPHQEPLTVTVNANQNLAMMLKDALQQLSHQAS
ncbi:gluconokinase [Shewanella intestini]|nr:MULTISPECIES: gluconokinase [Shewanella]